MKKNQHILILLCLIISTGYSQVRMPSVFADNMILQRNSEVNIWGWASPGETLRIVGSWNPSDTVNVTVERHSTWKTKIKTTQAGGPYNITVLGSGGYKIENVMLGEVWLCSGQSNMEWSYNHGLSNAEVEIPAANHPEIRIFNTPRIASYLPQEDCKGEWEVCTPEVMRKTSGVAYFFARRLHKELDVPVGIIVSAWGGTCAEVWIEKSAVESEADFMNANSEQEVLPWWPEKPGTSYNGMIYPIKPFNIAGFIWYQGEGNTKNTIYSCYDRLMRRLIDTWRDDFGKDLPFYFVQIAPFNYKEGWSAERLREQQTLTSEYRKTGMIVVSDLIEGNTSNIHPGNKWDVGKRLADMALANDYGIIKNPHKYPKYKTISIEKGKAYITFDCDIVIKGDKAIDILIAAEDGNFVPAEARIENGKLVVWNKKIKTPKAVRYAFTNNAIGNLFSSENLPVVPFRTDNWK